MRSLLSLSVAIALLAGASARAQESGNEFHWTGAVAAGHWLHLRSISGRVDVVAGTGPTLVVDAKKVFRHGDPKSVTITVDNTNGDVLVCAIWRNADESSCTADGYSSHSHHHHDDDDNDVSVDFTVHLPRGVNFGTSTVNGDISIDGATGKVVASTVNGSVDALSAGGPVEASTVNGDVEAHMGTVSEAVNLNYSTVNGSVKVYLPATLNAEVDLSTVNGSFHSDYPMSTSGRIDPRHLHATIGTGGPRLRCSTVNGSIDLRKT